MPIYSPTGFLDVTNATLRGSKIVTTSNVGIANLNPLNTLSVGSNLQVEDTGSNVLTIRGNAAATAMTLGVITLAPTYSLEVVSNIGNTVSNTVQFTNDTTGFVSTANIEVGTNNLFVDTTTGEVTVGNKLNVTDAHISNLTVASALYANAATGRVGVNTTNPGDFALDVHGSANVGALTANSLVVTGNLAVAGEITSIRSTTVTVDDPIIGLANNNTTGVLDVGFVMQRPDANVAIVFDESSDTLEIGYTQGKHTDTTITMDDSSLFHTNIHGNVSVSNLNIGQFSVVAAYGLDHVTNENNSTGDTIISTNGTTGLQTTANVDVGRDALVSGNVVVSQDLTVDTSTFHVDSSTNRVGVLTTSPGYDLDVHGSANVGTLTTGNLEVGTANLFVDTTTGNVGVGTTTPRAPLDINDTGAMIVPVGTTAEQPGTVYAGMVRFNTTLGKLQFYNGTEWLTVGGVSATGGTVTSIAGYKVHTFTTDGTFTLSSPTTVDYVLVGGGGGGGSGGGGAGGFVSGSASLNAGNYTIEVGAGGTGGGGGGTQLSLTTSTSGEDSTAFGLTAYGGGKGGGEPSTSNRLGENGGSGGGHGYDRSSDTRTTGTSGQGYGGGRAGTNGLGGAGGGGGASENGKDGSGIYGGRGGDGILSDISGTLTYYAGGGGGGLNENDNISYDRKTNIDSYYSGLGGLGGGGAGTVYGYATNGTVVSAENGTDGLGGGGGGTDPELDTGGNGGDGVVIIRYLS